MVRQFSFSLIGNPSQYFLRANASNLVEYKGIKEPDIADGLDRLASSFFSLKKMSSNCSIKNEDDCKEETAIWVILKFNLEKKKEEFYLIQQFYDQINIIFS